MLTDRPLLPSCLLAGAFLALLAVGCSGGAVWAPGGMLFGGDDVIRVRAGSPPTRTAALDRVLRTLDRSPFRIDTLVRQTGYVRTVPRPLNDTLGVRLHTVVRDSALVEITAEETDLRSRSPSWTRVDWHQDKRGGPAWSLMTAFAQQVGTIERYDEDPEYDTIACGGRRYSSDKTCYGFVCQEEKAPPPPTASNNHLPFGDDSPTADPSPTDTTQAQPPPSTRPLPGPTQPPGADEHIAMGNNKTSASQAIFEQTNAKRTARSLSPLRRDTTLARIACRHNKDMLAHDYMGHEDSDGRQADTRVAREHRRLIGGAGENVYSVSGVAPTRSPSALRDQGATAVEGWMDSPGHRENILRETYSHLGACYTERGRRGRATQVFGDVTAYLNRPLPWSMAAGDSLTVRVTPVSDLGPPVLYTFTSPDAPLSETLSQVLKTGAGAPFENQLHVPDTPGLYATRFIFRDDENRFWIRSGPRMRVE